MKSIMKTEIIYEDAYLLVVRKPAGLAVQSARVGQPDVVSELKNYLSRQNKDVGRKESYLGVVHRLDQPVEGLLAFAKDAKTAAALTRQLTDGALNKQYYAVLCGKPVSLQGELVDDIRKEGSLARVVTGQKERFPDAKRAVLQYRILEQISTPLPLSLADIHIATGRFHQIRVQFAHAGLPLLGDAKYGDKSVDARSLGVGNVALCAYYLEFYHPVTRQKLSLRVHPQNPAFAYFGKTEMNFKK